MTKIAFIFPGQGAQYIGMGKEFYEDFAPAKEIFNRASEALGFDLKELCFNGPESELKKTSICQPAILTVSIIALEALRSKFNEKQIFKPSYCAGLSLGEYSALVACGVLTLEDALGLVKRRAELMSIAAKDNPGTMAAVLGLDKEKVKEISKEVDVEVANLNCPKQTVISGKVEGIHKAKDLALKAGARNVVILEVSGAFHSSLMKSILPKYKEELQNTNISVSKIPVVSNVTAREESTPEQIRQNLEAQIHSSVLWEDSIRYISSQEGVDTFFEIGPSKVLKGLLRRIDSNLKVYNIEKPQDLDNLPI